MRRPRSSDASLTRALRGPFGLLWAGQSVSMLGDGVFLVAFTWQIAVEWQRPALLGLLLAARVLAELATLGLGGWIIDRLPRRTTVLGTDAGRALLVLGPALGAGLVGLGSATTALRLDALSFLLAAASVLPLPGRSPASSTSSRLAQALEGFRTVRRVGWVGGTILVCSLGNLGIIGAERLALPKAAELHYGQLGGYGAVLVALGVGAAVAALLTARSSRHRDPGRT